MRRLVPGALGQFKAEATTLMRYGPRSKKPCSIATAFW
jgi:hypothetical protein